MSKTTPLGKLWTAITFHLREFFSPRDAHDLLNAGKQVLIDKARGNEAAVTGELAKAAVAVLAAIDKHEEICCRVGSILIVRTRVSGQQRTIVETLSPQLARKLEENPSILLDPSRALLLLDEAPAASATAPPTVATPIQLPIASTQAKAAPAKTSPKQPASRKRAKPKRKTPRAKEGGGSDTLGSAESL